MDRDRARRSPRPQPALGIAIRSIRVERSETQRALAAAAGISVFHLSKIEHGITNPTWASVTALARAFGMPIRDLAARFEEIDLDRIGPTRSGRRAVSPGSPPEPG